MGVRTDQLEREPNDIRRGGMSGYLLPFEIISIHLVVVLVGAAVLGRAATRVPEAGDSAWRGRIGAEFA